MDRSEKITVTSPSVALVTLPLIIILVLLVVVRLSAIISVNVQY